MAVLDRIKSLYRIWGFKKNKIAFHASFFSYCDENVTVSDFVRLCGKTVLTNVNVGRCTYFAGASAGNADIGSFCSIGPGAKIGGLGKHPVDMISTHPIFYSTKMQSGITFSDKDYFDEQPKTTVGHDVWVGANAIILDGVNIGNGAIVAAGAVVVKDVPAFSIVGGVPAKIIRYRFSDEDISKINETNWWNLTLSEIKKITPLMRDGNIDALLEKINNNDKSDIPQPGQDYETPRF